MIRVQTPIDLEPGRRELADATSKSPFFFELELAAARRVLDELRAAPIDKLPIEEEWITVPASVGDDLVRIVKPRGVMAAVPVGVYLHTGGWVYMHGGGWVLGNRLSAAAQCRAGGLMSTS
jgi:acetyl esterase/lipase